MPLLDHFDLLAPFYDQAIRLHDAERWLRLARLPSGGRLLDAGGGTGRIGKALLPHVDQVVVVDLSSGMLRQAVQKGGLAAICAYSEKLPFADASFERVIMVDAFHHICDARQTAAELWRVTRPGGRIVIEEPDIRTFVVKIVAVVEKLALMRSHFISPPRIAQLFAYPEATVQMIRSGYTTWVTIDRAG